MKKQTKIIFYLLDHYPVENSLLYKLFKNLYSDETSKNNKMIRKVKYRFEQKIKNSSINELRKEYLDRYGQQDQDQDQEQQKLTPEEIVELKKIIASNNKSNNKSNNESNNESNNIIGKRKKHTINLNIELVKKLKKKAKKQNISLSEILNQLINRFLDE